MRISLRLFCACLAIGCAATPQASPYLACEAVGNARPVCGFTNPEDLVALPGGHALVVSEYGAMEGGRSGGLALLVLATDERRVLFRGGDASGDATPGWGDPACPSPPPPGFSPHGIDLQVRSDGALALAAVQHGGRESIELFEVLGADTDWRVEWRGCVIPSQEAWLNDVILLSDGGLLASHMMSRSQGMEALTEGSREPGYVLRWDRGKDFRRVPGTEGLLVNGLEVSKDEKTLYLNVSFGNVVRKIDLASGRELGAARVESPDNSTWSPDGLLLVASLRATDPAQFAFCQALTRGACPIPFHIVAVDPASMRVVESRYVGDGPPMGAGTVGLQVGDELFIGSFAGDRLLRVNL